MPIPAAMLCLFSSPTQPSHSTERPTPTACSHPRPTSLERPVMTARDRFAGVDDGSNAVTWWKAWLESIYTAPSPSPFYFVFFTLSRLWSLALSRLVVSPHGPSSWSLLMVPPHGPSSWSFLMVFPHGPSPGPAPGPVSWSRLLVPSSRSVSWPRLLVPPVGPVS
ncbi:hypothetical protein K402DRAFT_403642 [Aulographum hederae CBS 113979]|uniref:Uncharacterized protein n=1 Tax=Aulographum hederae CBS 113979 TaxID=1176131 RepID=A0A6G1H3J8_9PEZI|nr:hypothetical protein K402DRAFT_403642 [Aulographum hederae CBS 113979]